MKLIKNWLIRRKLKRVERETIEYAKSIGFKIDHTASNEAVEVSPDIVIFRFITQTKKELNQAEESGLTKSVEEKVRELLQKYKYPSTKLLELPIAFESYEKIDEVCDGNEYLYFK